MRILCADFGQFVHVRCIMRAGWRGECRSICSTTDNQKHSDRGPNLRLQPVKLTVCVLTGLNLLFRIISSRLFFSGAIIPPSV